MAGGNWTAQNMERPGIYINFTGGGKKSFTTGTRGTVAICRALSWGPVGKITELDAGMDPTPYIGYALTEKPALFLREMVKGTDVSSGPEKVLLYRPEASDAAVASAVLPDSSGGLTATALYPGVRGNDIAVTVSEDVDETGKFYVTTLVDGVQKDVQHVGTVADLTGNSWVTFSGAGPLAACAGVKLTGGKDGTVSSAAYTQFLTTLEPYRFDVLAYDGEDATVRDAMIAFVKRLVAQEGRYTQLVTSGAKNVGSQYVINCGSGVVLEDGTTLSPKETVWWLAGAEAGAKYYQSLTYAVYPGAVDVSPRLTGSQIKAAIQAGDLVLSQEFGNVRVETDINTLTTFTESVGKAFRKNRTMRICCTLANDIYREFSLNYVGKIANNEVGRGLFQGAILDYLLTMYQNNALQERPSGEDIDVWMGDDADSIVINLALLPADAVEKIYMTITVA